MTKRTLRLVGGIAALGLLSASAMIVFAAGSGGGGSVPTCTEDTWTCGDWSACSSEGRQARTCALTNDCSGVSTPKPVESQICTPPEKPSCMPRPACLDTTPRCLLPEPAEGWCPAPPGQPPAQTPKEVPSSPQLRCGNKTTLRERVSCRLNLSEEELRSELQIQYLPEECRALGAASRQSCVAQYRAFQPCWEMPLGPGRVACGRQVLKLGPVISEEVKTCQGKAGAEQVACKADLRARVFSMIKFRFYELEERAEEILENAENKKPLEDFQVFIETKKQEFNAAGSKEERRQTILDVRSGWQKFVREAREALGEGESS